MNDLSTHGIVLFDGTCLFCEGSVSFIARRDPKGYFKFGASQSASGQQVLQAHGVDGAAARSIVLIEGGTTYVKSTASLRIARRLSFPWNLAGVLIWVPLPIRDYVYGLVAAARHNIAGRSNACEIPPAAIRDRLI